MADRFVIEPQFDYWTRTGYAQRGAKPVPENFRYSSDSNKEWLDIPQIKALVEHETAIKP
jgi:UDP-N-acetylglucosamine 4,6-dehydratase